MKMVLMALTVLALLGGGAGGAYFYFKNPAAAAVGATEEHQAAKEAPAGGHGGGHGAKGGHEFVEIDPLILPIVDNQGVSQTVTLVVVIEVPGKGEAETVKYMQPRIKDAYIQELYGVLNKHAAMQGGVVQVGMIKERLQKITQHVLGEDVAVDVLLQVVQQRPI